MEKNLKMKMNRVYRCNLLEKHFFELLEQFFSKLGNVRRLENSLEMKSFL